MRISRKLWKRLATALLALVVLLLLFIVAFVFNPFEGAVRDVRDLVPREVDFFLRKVDLDRDFVTRDGQIHFTEEELPKPLFWEDLVTSRAWSELRQGPFLSGLQRDYAGVMREAARGLASFRQNSGGLLDLGSDLIGRELILAGYFEDRSGAAPRPLAQPWWCAYTRVSWRVRAGWGLMQWSMVQDEARKNGVDIQSDGAMLAIKLPSGEQLYAARQLDCLMIANHRPLLGQAERLALGAEDEEPFGKSAKYTDGIISQLLRWEDAKRAENPSRVEFSLTTNTLDGFRRFAQSWPNAQNKDSMNERVMARFLNLKGWNSASGAVVFEPDELTTMGEVVMNSHMHSAFQSSFYRAEQQTRGEWLDPFLRMVPETSCAAAALRMPVGDFLSAMFDAMPPDEQQLLDDSLRRCMYQGQQLEGFRDLVNRIQVAFLPRTGFVFRRNVPDPEIKVVARSPVPQIAWVFWLRPGSDLAADAVLGMLRKYRRVFSFDPVYQLPIPGVPDLVSEFCNPQIPGTGEIAAIVFKEFLVLSNSGPLIKDILRTRYDPAKSIVASNEYQRFHREMPQATNGFVWVSGQNLIPVLDDYRQASDSRNQMPDPVWMQQNRSTAEEVVRRQQFPSFRSISEMPPSVRDGQYEDAVQQWLRDQWSRAATGLSNVDLPAIEQLKSMAALLQAGFLHVELRNNYIRFLGKLVARW
jgi:hypothetical protein